MISTSDRRKRPTPPKAPQMTSPVRLSVQWSGLSWPPQPFRLNLSDFFFFLNYATLSYFEKVLFNIDYREGGYIIKIIQLVDLIFNIILIMLFFLDICQNCKSNSN